MKNINKILLIFLVVLVILLVGVLSYLVFFKNEGGNFYAVYLRTGDLYFGKLVKFPYFGLKQVYLFQVNPQNQQSPLSVQKFSNIFWGPEDFIKINKENVVWLAKLNKDGQLYQLIKNNPQLVPQQDQLNQNQPLPNQNINNQTSSQFNQ